MMSVPRPAMFVETVIAPLRPACATTYASLSWCLALRTACGIFFFFRMRAMAVALLDAGRADEDRLPRSWHSRISLTTAVNFSRSVL